MSSASSPALLTDVINSNISSYIGTNGELTLILFNEDQDNGSNDGAISIDNVEVIVSSAAPTVIDTITNFQVGAGDDVLNFDDLLPDAISNSSDLGTLDDYLQFEFDGSDTIIHVDHNGGGTFQPTMDVVLENVDLTSGNTLSNQQVLQDLLDNGQIVV